MCEKLIFDQVYWRANFFGWLISRGQCRLKIYRWSCGEDYPIKYSGMQS